MRILSDINKYADEDRIVNVSAKTNNPSAVATESFENIKGFDQRRKFYDIIKITLDYENCK